MNYWKDDIDWRRAESQLNELPQFYTQIEVNGFGVLDTHCGLTVRYLKSGGGYTKAAIAAVRQISQGCHSPSIQLW